MIRYLMGFFMYSTKVLKSTPFICHQSDNKVDSDSNFKVKRVYQKVIDTAIKKGLDKSKAPLSMKGTTHYETLYNHVSFCGASEINIHLQNKSIETQDADLIKAKKEEITDIFKKATNITCLMNSGALRTYLARIIDRDEKVRVLSKSDRNELIESAYEQFDKQIDQVISTNNLKTPTISYIKELVGIIVKDVFENQTKVTLDETPKIKLRDKTLTQFMEREIEKLYERHGFIGKRSGLRFSADLEMTK